MAMKDCCFRSHSLNCLLILHFLCQAPITDYRIPFIAQTPEQSPHTHFTSTHHHLISFNRVSLLATTDAPVN